MKNSFMMGLGIGFIFGAFVLKNCPAINKAYDSCEHAVKDKIDECQEMVKRKKQQKSNLQEEPMPMM